MKNKLIKKTLVFCVSVSSLMFSAQTIAQSIVFEKDEIMGQHQVMIKSDCTFIFRVGTKQAIIANLKDVRFKLSGNDTQMEMFCKTGKCVEIRQYLGGEWKVAMESDYSRLPGMWAADNHDILEAARRTCKTPFEQVK